MLTPEMVSFKEAADYFEVSLNTLREIVKRNNLEVMRDPVDARRKLLDKAQLADIKARSIPRRNKSDDITSDENKGV